VDDVEPADLERLAVASHLTGRDDESARAWERAHVEYVRQGELEAAARCCFWLGMTLLLRGESAHGGGWIARAHRFVDEIGGETSVRGLLMVPAFLGALHGGDAQAADAMATEMVDLARRLPDPDLFALGLLCRGEVALSLGEMRSGLQLFDEAMVAVVTDEVSPIAKGIVYCAVIDSCMQACDFRRAAEWTEVLERWCAERPDLVPFRGQCLVHRSQVLAAHGDWSGALAELEQARERLSRPPHPALGLCLYELGELHRLRGDHRAAEVAYRTAIEHGHESAPGFALLRLAEGKIDAAAAATRRMLDGSTGQANRPEVLAAAVEVLLAAGDVDGAGAASAELTELARAADVMLLAAMADYADGLVLLATGDAARALVSLRHASEGWRDLGMAYDGARARVQIAAACRGLCDEDVADLELQAARSVFERLGAAADLARLDALRVDQESTPVLTERECEVLRLVASGQTNRDIAASLVISEHTVARHLQNIFMKLQLSSRAAATAYAYENGLI